MADLDLTIWDFLDSDEYENPIWQFDDVAGEDEVFDEFVIKKKDGSVVNDNDAALSETDSFDVRYYVMDDRIKTYAKAGLKESYEFEGYRIDLVVTNVDYDNAYVFLHATVTEI